MSRSKSDEGVTAASFEANLSAEIAPYLNQQSYPPVHQWHPPYCGEIEMRIAADGRWFYMGSPIVRTAMVKLFASVLRLDDDGHYYLVTPVEKVRIQVEDAPLLIVDMVIEQDEQDRDQLIFKTTVDDWVRADRDHPIEMRLYQNQQRPYICVRDNLWALIHRNLFYRLVECAVVKGDRLFLESATAQFDLGCIHEGGS